MLVISQSFASHIFVNIKPHYYVTMLIFDIAANQKLYLILLVEVMYLYTYNPIVKITTGAIVVKQSAYKI